MTKDPAQEEMWMYMGHLRTTIAKRYIEVEGFGCGGEREKGKVMLSFLLERGQRI